jgi:three-Cys-motif partner protein
LSKELADSDPEKWVYSEHAAAKHEILRRYLGAWLPILGAANNRLVIYDGFAGRGRYRDGEDGSPVLIFKRAVEAVDAGRPREVSIRCVEADRQNYLELEQVIEGLSHEGVATRARHDEFDVIANESADHAQRIRGEGGKPPPAFFFADPFGFSGVKLATLGRLMGIRRWEVLLTFMVRDMRRFLEQPNFEAPLTEFFGGESWGECTEAEDRESCLLLRFSQTVRDTKVARFATPFRVFEDERKQTLYYLVHLSNEPLGMREMKKAMIKTSPDMTFWPVTVRPPEQLALDTKEQPPYPELQTHLLSAYAGRRMTFEDLLNADYTEGLWLEPAYRTAVKDMAGRDSGGVTIYRNRGKTKTGKEPTGLELGDTVQFDLRLDAG